MMAEPRPMVVALVDDLFFQQPIEAAAGALGYDVEFAAPADDVVTFLVARQPRLMIVDLNVSSVDWERWVLTAKTSPATRRIPVLSFGSHTDAGRLDRARKAGCDAVLSNGAFKADIAGHIRKHTRADDTQELLRQAAQPLPELALKGIQQFNAREFYEQHETLEQAWREEPGPVRQLYQGILQVGVAFYQIERRNYAGALKMFQRARQYLSVLPDVCQGVDVARLRRDALAAQAELERLGTERIATFDPALIPRVEMAGAEATAVRQSNQNTP